jgi:hypothetical protein
MTRQEDNERYNTMATTKIRKRHTRQKQAKHECIVLNSPPPPPEWQDTINMNVEDDFDDDLEDKNEEVMGMEEVDSDEEDWEEEVICRIRLDFIIISTCVEDSIVIAVTVIKDAAFEVPDFKIKDDAELEKITAKWGSTPAAFYGLVLCL